jgi:hypothetical protein
MALRMREVGSERARRVPMEVGDGPGLPRRTLLSRRVFDALERPSMPTPQELLDRLESRHDELIQKLDDLNVQIEAALAQFAKKRSEDSSTNEVAGEVRPTERPLRRAA